MYLYYIRIKNIANFSRENHNQRRSKSKNDRKKIFKLLSLFITNNNNNKKTTTTNDDDLLLSRTPSEYNFIVNLREIFECAQK